MDLPPPTLDTPSIIPRTRLVTEEIKLSTRNSKRPKSLIGTPLRRAFKSGRGQSARHLRRKGAMKRTGWTSEVRMSDGAIGKTMLVRFMTRSPVRRVMEGGAQKRRTRKNLRRVGVRRLETTSRLMEVGESQLLPRTTADGVHLPPRHRAQVGGTLFLRRTAPFLAVLSLIGMRRLTRLVRLWTRGSHWVQLPGD